MHYTFMVDQKDLDIPSGYIGDRAFKRASDRQHVLIEVELRALWIARQYLERADDGALAVRYAAQSDIGLETCSGLNASRKRSKDSRRSP
jgi:hypothetical protein